MGIAYTGFNSYSIQYLSQDPNREAIVLCYQDTEIVGYIEFVKNGVDLPPNVGKYHASTIYYRLSRFQNIVSMLREESPLMLQVNTNTGVGMLTTASREPVGDEEGN